MTQKSSWVITYICMYTINIVYAHEALLVLIVNVHITLCLVNICEHACKINNIVMHTTIAITMQAILKATSV